MWHVYQQLDLGSNATRCGASSGDAVAATAAPVPAADVVSAAPVANEIFLQLVYFHTNDFDFRSDDQPPVCSIVMLLLPFFFLSTFNKCVCVYGCVVYECVLVGPDGCLCLCVAIKAPRNCWQLLHDADANADADGRNNIIPAK